MKVKLEIRYKVTTPSGSKKIYDCIYATSAIRHSDSFYQWLLRLLDIQPGRLLLDVSCGVGSLPRLAYQMGLRAYGVDFSEVALHIARKEAPFVNWVIADGERLPYPDASFDYVTHIGSLEHYLNPETGVQEITRVLKPEGRACILLPNTFGLLGNVWFALRTGRTFDDGQPIQRYATRYEWQDLLESGGLRILRTIKYEREWPRNLSDALWYIKHPKSLIRLLLSPLIPLNWANYFVFLCQRAQ